jgi:FixJ family two-component response regulator
MTQARPLILVVDDDQAVRQSLKFALELESLDVRVFARAADLMAHADFAAAGCIVLDNTMPGTDGFAVLRLLAERKIALPVVLMTEHATAHLRHRASRAGIPHLVEKPILGDTLIRAIRSMLHAAAGRS